MDYNITGARRTKMIDAFCAGTLQSVLIQACEPRMRGEEDALRCEVVELLGNGIRVKVTGAICNGSMLDILMPRIGFVDFKDIDILAVHKVDD